MTLARLTDLPGALPIALLPVRLETRFSGTQLLIRVYPDDIHRDTFEPELTPEELAWGCNFWLDTWRAGKNAPGGVQELAAWKHLASRFGAPRAAWLADALTPLNPYDRPALPNLDPKIPLTATPNFPARAARKASWTRAGVARALPDRWLALGMVADATVATAEGSAIQPGLAVGPNPSAVVPAAGTLPPGKPPVDPGMLWMVDFDAAVAAGMGLHMDISAAPAGLDRLVVVGVRRGGAGAGTAGAAELRKLLDAHRYTWGLSIPPLSAPTNNSEASPSGYQRADPNYQASFDLRGQPEPDRGIPGDPSHPDDQGSRLAAALGLSADTFARTDGARATEAPGTAEMHRALWPATLGYYVEQFFDGVLPGYDANACREFFATWVRPRGPLPPLRIGRQPYGVLPVTSLDGWGAAAPPLLPLLKSLRDAWRTAAPGAPHAGRDTATPGRDIIEALGQQPRSSSYAWRWTRGPEYLRNFFRLPGVGIDPGAIETALGIGSAQARAALQKIGLNPANPPRITGLSYSDTALDVGPFVQADGSGPEQPLQSNYIARLANPALSLQAVHDDGAGAWPDATPKPLLYQLLRHATLLAYARQALDDSLTEPGPPFGVRGAAPPWFDLEIIDGLTPAPTRDTPAGGFKTPTFWRVLQSPVHDPRNPAQIIARGELLRQTVVAGAATPLGAFLAALALLAQQPVAQLEAMTADALDVCSHRLDVWVTALASRQLDRARATPNAQGVGLGGYGWLEGVRRRAANAASDGFVHTPSIAHANAAAVLRSAYLAHGDQPEGARLQVDLSSRRVRGALALVDGVRQGQPMGALLGYRLERRLHELELEALIAPLRALAPLVAGQLTPTAPGEPLEAIAANNVVDGMKLLLALAATPDLFAPAPFGANRAVLESEAAALRDAVDAINDLALAEGVYQAVQGNAARAAATLDAVSRGDTLTEFDVVRTPVSGTGFTQRVVVLMDAALAAPSPWNTAAPRACAEPALEAWCARMLGAPSRVKFAAAYVPPGSGETKIKVFTLDALKLCALDIVYAPPITPQPAQTDLELRLARLAAADAPPGARVELRYARDDAKATDAELTLPELCDFAAALRTLVTNARALDARDLGVAGNTDAAGVAVASLQARYRTVLAAWNGATGTLDEALRGGVVPTTPAAFAAAVDAMSGFGVKHAAAPLSGVPAAADLTALVAHAKDIQAQAQAIALQLPAGDPGTLLADAILAALSALFGPAFRVAPPFALPAGSNFGAAVEARIAVHDADGPQTAEWLRVVATVREGAARLRTASLLADVVGGQQAPPLRVAQLPKTAAPWNRLQDETVVGATSILAAMPGLKDPFALPAALSGLMVDEWVDVLPRRTATTGLTVQHESPAAAAPQAILLAAAPDPTQLWSEDTLARIVSEALDLGKLRMVDFDALPPLGQFLPAVMLANNVGGDAAGDTVSTLPE